MKNKSPQEIAIRRERARRYYEKLKQDPVRLALYLEKQRTRQNEWRNKKKDDPEYKERVALAQRRRYQKNPERYRAYSRKYS